MPTTLSTQISLIAAIVNLAVAVVVLLHNPRRPLNQAFSLLAFSLFGWNAGTSLGVMTGWSPAHVLEAVSLSFVPVTSYHFVLAFVGKHRVQGWQLLQVAYGVAFLVAGLVVFFPGLIPFWHSLFCFLALPPLFFLGLYRLYQRLRRTLSNLEKAQLVYIFVGSSFALVLAFTNVLAGLGLTTYSLANLGSFFFTVLIAVVIVRFGFLDIGVVVGRALLLLIVATLLYLLYRFMGLWFEETTFALFFNILLATLFLILVYDPLRRVMEDLADRILQKDAHTFQESLARLSKDINAIFSPDELLAHVYFTLLGAARVRTVSIFVQEGEDKVFRQVQPPVEQANRRARIEADKALPVYLRQNPRILVRDELESDLNLLWLSPERRKILLAVQRTLTWQGMDICVPFLIRGKFRGLMFLSLSDPGAMLNFREKDLLFALGGQMASALESAQIYRRMSERDRLASLGEMATGLAHEIRNPLGAIQGAAQYLLSTPPPESQEEFLNIILSEVERLNHLLGRFLVFARPSRQRLEPHSLKRLVESTLPLARSPVGGEGDPVTLVTELDPAYDTVTVDGELLRQVLLNLLLNARQAMPDGGTITITSGPAPRTSPGLTAEEDEMSAEEASEGTGEVLLSVRDEGVGIPREAQKHVFTPFYTTKDEGTGLGLAICQRIIQDHGGRIEVESAPGEGSTFKVFLPYATATPSGEHQVRT
jgi:two-component system, NtrC family, sensor histidine kinase HydH